MACTFMAIFFGVLTAVCAEGGEAKRVLVVHSFGSVAPPFTTHSIAFETELVRKLGARVDLDEVSLDMARYADSTLQEALVEYLQKRQAHWQPDLVVPIGSPAGIFVEQYRDRLFPDAAILYTGMDRRRLSPDALKNNAAFVGSSFDLPGFVEDILQIAPSTKNIAVVIGASPLEQYWAAAFRKEFEPFANRINFIWLNDLPFDQMLEKTKALPPDTFIFLVLLLRDAAGVTHNADEALQRIHAVANAPVNSIFQHQLGLGIVGGRLYQAELEGIESARIAVRILHGEPTSSFPPMIVPPLPPRYDWRELQRWKINEKNLPPGSVILFREPNTWEKFSVWIKAGALFCFVQAVLLLVLFVNLMKRRRAERLLIESEDRVSLATEAAQLGVWELDLASNKVWVSEEMRELFQIAPGTDVDYTAFQKLVHPDDRPLREAAIKRAIETRGSYETEFRILMPDGTVRWISGRARCIHNGGGSSGRLLGVSMDVTKRKQAEELFELVTESSPNGILLVDDKGRIILVNAHAEELFGFKREELMGKPVETLIPERFAREQEAHRISFLAAMRPQFMGAGRELYACRKDGSEFPVEVGLNPILTSQGRLVLASIADITQRIKSEKETLEQRDELFHLSRVATMGHLSGSIAHELNQPLGIILSNAQAAQRMLAMSEPNIPELKEILTDIISENRRAGEVIMRLRALLKRGETRLLPVALNKIVKDVVLLLRSDFIARGIAVQTALTDELPDVAGDQVHLQQVLLNIIINACDAMEQNAPQDRVLKIATSQREDRVCLTVEDQGVGLPEGDADRIFKPFYTTKSQGLGIGLFICRSIIVAHHGQIWAEPKKGRGTIFHLELQTIDPAAL